VNAQRQPESTRVADDFRAARRALMSPEELAAEEEQQGLWARFAQAGLACTYAAYGVKPGDIDALARAKANGKRPGLVGIRIYHGDLQFTSVGLAAGAIAGGRAKLETF